MSVEMLTPKHSFSENDLFSTSHSLIRDVVIPKNGGGREISHTNGFCRYTNLVNDNTEAYRNLRTSEKRQFVIDKIITPLLNENRNFYRYDRKKCCYELVDLGDEQKIKLFTMNVVMQKIRDIVKQNDSCLRKTRNTIKSNPLTKVVNKRAPEPEKMRNQSMPDLISNDYDTYMTPDIVLDFEMIESYEDESIEDMCEDESIQTIGSIPLEFEMTENGNEFKEIFARCIIEDIPDLENKQPMNENNSGGVTFDMTPLLNILSSHPYFKYFMDTQNNGVNFLKIRTKLENKGYNSISAVEKDLNDLIRAVSEMYSSNHEIERTSRDFLALVTNYCRGVNHDH